MSDFNDQPNSLPAEDRYGFDPFAEAIANSLISIPAPEDSVIAINGPWGCGKSSVINLVKHHIAERQDDNVQIVDFRCWWFRGEE